MNLPHFSYSAPVTLDECTGILSEFGNRAAIFAGGTDLLVRMKLRLAKPEHLVSISRLVDLKRIIYAPGKGLAIGAGVTLSQIASNSPIKEKCSSLADAAELVATKQIRNTATIGGNVLQNTRCRYYNRSPVWGKAVKPCFKRNGSVCHIAPKGKRCFAVYQGDLAPLLIALNAKVIIESHTRTEEIPVESLFSDNGKEPFNEMKGKVIREFLIPDHSLSTYSAYKKYRLRGGIDYPLAGVAISVERKKNFLENLRICLTGVSSSPVLVHDIEQLIAGKPSDTKLIKEIGNFAQEGARALANLEDNPAKRRHMVRILTEELLTSLLA